MWTMNSNNLGNSFLVEQFKNCIHTDINTHADERDIDNLEDASTTTDDYALTHI